MASSPSDAAPEGPRESLLDTLRSNHAFQAIHNLLLWREPLATGLLFAILMVFLFLISFGGYTVINLTGDIACIFLLVSGLFIFGTKMYAQWKKQPVHNPISDRFASGQLGVSKEFVSELFEMDREIWNHCMERVRDVICFEHPLRSVAWIFILFVAGRVGGYVSGVTLLFALTVVAFVWPRVYHEKHELIDAQVAKASAKASEFYGMALDKLPPTIKAKLE